MRKTKYILCIILTVVFIFSSAAPAAALDDDKFELRPVTTYWLGMNTKFTLKLLFNSELPEIPYIDVFDYFQITFNIRKFPLEKNDDGTYCLPSQNGKMIIDTEADTVIIEDFEFFLSDGYKTAAAANSGAYIVSEETIAGESKPLFLDLGKYGIDIIERDDKVYFPVSVLNDIIAQAERTVEYIDGNLYYTLTSSIPDGYFDRSSVYERTEYSSALAEFYSVR